MSEVSEYLPGALLHARGREWIVMPQSSGEVLHLRPLGGSDDDIVALAPALEAEAPRPAQFEWPKPAQSHNHNASLLLRDALQLKLRSGCGPFRSFGHIAFEPRAYQLVPLLMALKQDVVRLLIADDVGIGKTIEAGLIAREMMDRGEIQRLTVLCPPHLVEQWQAELLHRFHIASVAVTAGSARRLERELPHGVSIFSHHPVTVVSLDYIKSDRNRHEFLVQCPNFVIVDEAHICSRVGQGRQQRYELLSKLAEDASRHLVLLTATPHSGDDVAFNNLLALLDPVFAQFASAGDATRKKLRERLADHLVQRRRQDIEEWRAGGAFPNRKKAEVTYRLTGDWGQLFDDVLDYCVGLSERAEQEGENKGRMMWYATLALLRCVASSPASAVNALQTRLEGQLSLEELDEAAKERVFDGAAEEYSDDDLEPAAQVEDSEALQRLIASAHRLAGAEGDPKLAALTKHIKGLLRDGFRPVVFCRYIATAHYVCEHLRAAFGKATIEAITGELTPEEREARVAELGEADQPILVATDCLSEGINLQQWFTAVVHYDLAWNPTRHEQREGRVDRFGQPADEVRCTMLYGEDNPVDGFILRVILRKAERIKEQLGVRVPVPDDQNRLTQAVLKAVLLQRRDGKSPQTGFDFELPEEARQAEAEWEDAWKRSDKSRTVFQQQRLKPENVLPEWQQQLAVLGDQASVERFVRDACSRLDSPLEPRPGGSYGFRPQHFGPELRERLQAEGFGEACDIAFGDKAPRGARWIHRSSPLVAVLADALIEAALEGESQLVARAGVCRTRDVDVVTRIVLLRMRHQLRITRGGQTRLLLAEETGALAWRGRKPGEPLEGQAALALLQAAPSSNVPDAKREQELTQALDLLNDQRPVLEAHARARAEALLADHRRVREASEATGRYAVDPCLPVDVMGVYVLLPEDL